MGDPRTGDDDPADRRTQRTDGGTRAPLRTRSTLGRPSSPPPPLPALPPPPNLRQPKTRKGSRAPAGCSWHPRNNKERHRRIRGARSQARRPGTPAPGDQAAAGLTLPDVRGWTPRNPNRPRTCMAASCALPPRAGFEPTQSGVKKRMSQKGLPKPGRQVHTANTRKATRGDERGRPGRGEPRRPPAVGLAAPGAPAQNHAISAASPLERPRDVARGPAGWLGHIWAYGGAKPAQRCTPDAGGLLPSDSAVYGRAGVVGGHTRHRGPGSRA